MKISRTTRGELNTLAEEITTAGATLSEAVDKFNSELGGLWEAVEAARAEYNEKLAALRDRIEGVADDLQSEYDDKSEKWQEGDRGQAASEWIDTIREAAGALEDVEIEMPDELSVDIPDANDVVGGFEDAPES